MGLDFGAIELLLEAEQSPGFFSSVITLGRQELQHFDRHSLKSLLVGHGHPASEEQAEAILREGDGFAEPLFRFLGAKKVDSIDTSSYENASIIHDMNEPTPDRLRSSYEAVIDGGCLEHIFNFPVAIRNCMEMLAVGGKFLSLCCGNNFMGHGLYQFSPELFFRVFDQENGFEMERMILLDPSEGAHWYEVSDPKRVGNRVEAVTKSPVYLFVQARKVAEVPVFASPPQQSDYSLAWKQASQVGAATVHRANPVARERAVVRLKRITKQIAPNFLQALYRKTRDARASRQYNPQHFKKIR
jgi:hypothetical protein